MHSVLSRAAPWLFQPGSIHSTIPKTSSAALPLPTSGTTEAKRKTPAPRSVHRPRHAVLAGATAADTRLLCLR